MFTDVIKNKKILFIFLFLMEILLRTQKRMFCVKFSGCFKLLNTTVCATWVFPGKYSN